MLPGNYMGETVFSKIKDISSHELSSCSGFTLRVSWDTAQRSMQTVICLNRGKCQVQIQSCSCNESPMLINGHIINSCLSFWQAQWFSAPHVFVMNCIVERISLMSQSAVYFIGDTNIDPHAAKNWMVPARRPPLQHIQSTRTTRI